MLMTRSRDLPNRAAKRSMAWQALQKMEEMAAGDLLSRLTKTPQRPT